MNTSAKTSVTVRLTPELQEWLREEAQRQERSISWVIERAVKRDKAAAE